jgi:hypothetical protein
MPVTAARYSQPSRVAMQVMSLHHLVLILAASAVKSRRIASARAVAAGSAMVVFFRRRGARSRSGGRSAREAWQAARETFSSSHAA